MSGSQARPARQDTATASDFRPVLQLMDCGKSYRLYARPQERLKQEFWPRRRYYSEFWALRGVSFSVARGETFLDRWVEAAIFKVLPEGEPLVTGLWILESRPS